MAKKLMEPLSNALQSHPQHHMFYKTRAPSSSALPSSSSSSSSLPSPASHSFCYASTTLAAHHPSLGSSLQPSHPSKFPSISSKDLDNLQIQSLGDLQLLISSSHLASRPPILASSPLNKALEQAPNSPLHASLSLAPRFALHDSLNDLAPTLNQARSVTTAPEPCLLQELSSFNFSKASSNSIETYLPSSMYCSILAEPPSLRCSREEKLTGLDHMSDQPVSAKALCHKDEELIASSSKLLSKLPLPSREGIIKHRDASGEKMVEAAREFKLGTAIPYCGGENVKKKRDFTSMASEPTKDSDSTRVKKGCHDRSVGEQGTGRSGQRTKVQRENHILAERQRREEMNDKFCILRSLINKSSKKDKASIVGDTIDYILELEKQIKHLQRSTMSNQHNRINAKTITDSANDQDYETFVRPKVANLPPLTSNYTSSEEKSESGKRTRQANQPAASNSISDDTLNLNHVKSNQGFLCEDQFSSAPSKSSSPSTGEPGRHENCRDFTMEGGNVQVEVQHLGKQAVVKLLCTKSKGLVLRILAAMDECKVEILQSNVTTIDHQVVHFLTIEVNPGVSASFQKMEKALRVAASGSWHLEEQLCATQHKLESKPAYHKVLHSVR